MGLFCFVFQNIVTKFFHISVKYCLNIDEVQFRSDTLDKLPSIVNQTIGAMFTCEDVISSVEP